MMQSCVIWIFQLTFKYLKCWTTQEVNSAPFPFFLMWSLSQTKGFTGCGDWHMLITGNLCCPNLPYDGGATFYFREARASLAQLVKNPPAMWETWVWSLGWEDPLEKGKATHSSILYSPWGCKESDMTEQLSLTCCIWSWAQYLNSLHIYHNSPEKSLPYRLNKHKHNFFSLTQTCYNQFKGKIKSTNLRK